MSKGNYSNYFVLAVLTTSLAFTGSSQAAPFKDSWIPSSPANLLDVYLSAEPSFSRIHNDTAVQVSALVVNDYETNKQTNWNPLWGGGIGHTFEKLFNLPFSLSLGLAGYSVNFGNVKGLELPFINDDLFDTLNYQFKAKSTALLFETRWIYANYDWQPFAIIGVGAAWNRLSDFNEEPTDPALSAAPVLQGFGSHTNTAFAYELGIGVQRLLYADEKYNIRYTGSVDYRYVNFGKGEFSAYPTQPGGGALQVANLDTQAVMFTLKLSFL
jgi:opacity protein-like surface antigen